MRYLYSLTPRDINPCFGLQGITRRGSGLSAADVSRTPSPPNTSGPPSRKSSFSSLLLRRTADSGATAASGAASPESPGGPKRRLSALLKDAGRSRSRSRETERDKAFSTGELFFSKEHQVTRRVLNGISVQVTRAPAAE